MNAPCLAKDLTPRDSTTNKSSAMSCDSRTRHAGKIFVGTVSSPFKFIDKGTETRAKYQQDLSTTKTRCCHFSRQHSRQIFRLRTQRNIPATVAVIQEAKAPPNIARKASDAINGLRSGANGEMPPI